MGRRWGAAVWASDLTPGMAHGWAIDGHAWEPMGSQYGINFDHENVSASKKPNIYNVFEDYI